MTVYEMITTGDANAILVLAIAHRATSQPGQHLNQDGRDELRRPAPDQSTIESTDQSDVAGNAQSSILGLPLPPGPDVTPTPASDVASAPEHRIQKVGHV